MDVITIEQLRKETGLALNRLCKWRSLFAGWQLGTRGVNDPECQAVRDHREVTMLLRTEVNAMAALLIKKKLFAEAEWLEQLVAEANLLSEAYSRKFPGYTATDDGLRIDLMKAKETTKGWKP